MCGLSFCYAYIDDVLIASATPDEHKKHLHLTFNRLKEYGIIINPTKCVLGPSSLHFLGHLVDSQGIRPLEEKVKVIQDFPQPVTKHDLQIPWPNQLLPSFHSKLCPAITSPQQFTFNRL